MLFRSYIAHLSALTFTHDEILSESRHAPDGMLQDHQSSMTTTSEESFEIIKGGDLALKTANSDISTDNESD